jgi:DNA-binding transcriptional LysR family regulator
MLFVTSPQYPLPMDAPVKWSQLVRHPLIIQSEGSAARGMVLRQFKKRGLVPIIGAEVNNIELAKEFTRQNKGVAIMFEPNIRQEVARGELKIIQLEDGWIKVGAIDILVNREERLSPSVESFLMLIKKHFNTTLCEVPSKNISRE